MEELTKGLPQRDCYLHVLRDAMTVDSLDSSGFISARPAPCLWIDRRAIAESDRA